MDLELKKHGRTVPTIIVTGVVEEKKNRVDASRSMSVTECLAKPFERPAPLEDIAAMVDVAPEGHTTDLGHRQRTDADKVRRVLLVDDDREFAESVGEWLESCGCAFDTANDAAQAVEAVTRFDPELVLIDIHLGGVSGLDLVPRLKQHRTNLVCVMVAADAELDPALEALRSGVDDYLCKPLQRGELFATLERCSAKLPLMREKEASEAAVRRGQDQLEERVRQSTDELRRANQAVVTEIAERKRAEEALRESEERLRGILDNIADGVITIDEEGLIQSFNAAAEQTFGYAADDVVGRNVSMLMSEPDRTNHDVSIQRYLRTGQGSIIGVGSREVSGCRRDGSTFPLDLSVAEMTLGGRRSFIGMLRDITDRKRAQAQLIQSSKLAMLGEMAAAMAHELNQPLNVIHMAADSAIERIEEGAADAQYLGVKLGRISAQTERAARIIDHMCIFGHKADEEPEALDPRQVVNDTIGLVGEQLRLSNIEVETILPERCREVVGHAVQLEQVLLNLITNARHAIEATRRPPGDRHKISLIVEDEGQEDKVTLTVRDTGGGI
ncbi:MAG: PAS domain S-box protein, partial [Alphaproteobacteria bacterium]